MKEGYKKTDLGVIPEDWDIIELRKPLGHLEAGTSVNSSNDIQSTHRILKTSAIHGGIVDLNESKDVIPSDVCRLKCPVRQGSLIISRMNTPQLVGECGYVSSTRKDVYLPDRLWQTQNVEGFNYKWLNYLLNLPFYRNAVRAAATGTSNSMKNISKEDMYSISIPCPKIKEQNAIAEALSDIDALIANLEKLIEKKKAVKQGTMQELLTGKRRLEGFTGEWMKTSIERVCDTLSGGTPSRTNSDYYTGEIAWFTTSELSDSWLFDSAEHITESAVSESATKKYPPNTILIAMYGATIGKVGIISKTACSNQACCALISKSIDFLFLFYKLLSMRKVLIELGCGAGQPNISQKIIRELSIYVPASIKEQQMISEILQSMDKEIEEYKKQLTKYKLIKAGMMTELLTGKIRLV